MIIKTGSCSKKEGVCDKAGNVNEEIEIITNIEFRNVYTVKYNGNNSTKGSMGDTICEVGIDCQLRQNAFERTNYIFNGWNTNANGTGTSYRNGYKFDNGINNINDKTDNCHYQCAKKEKTFPSNVHWHPLLSRGRKKDFNFPEI